MKGSRTALSGSGISTMSDSWMPFQPAMDEPSNILPSLEEPFIHDLGGDADVLLLSAGVGEAQVDELHLVLGKRFQLRLRRTYPGILLWSMGLRIRRGETVRNSLRLQIVCQSIGSGAAFGILRAVVRRGLTALRRAQPRIATSKSRRGRGAYPSEGPRVFVARPRPMANCTETMQQLGGLIQIGASAEQNPHLAHVGIPSCRPRESLPDRLRGAGAEGELERKLDLDLNAAVEVVQRDATDGSGLRDVGPRGPQPGLHLAAQPEVASLGDFLVVLGGRCGPSRLQCHGTWR